MNYIIQQFINTLSTDFKNMISHLSSNPRLLSSLEEIVPMKINSLVLSSLVLLFQKLDNDFANSDYRINNYSIIAIKERTIVMNFDTITFKRRYYRNKSTGKYYFYVDDMLSLLP